MTSDAPCDWDGESHCACDCGCQLPATHQSVYAMDGNSLIIQMLCCRCSMQQVATVATPEMN